MTRWLTQNGKRLIQLFVSNVPGHQQLLWLVIARHSTPSPPTLLVAIAVLHTKLHISAAKSTALCTIA